MRAAVLYEFGAPLVVEEIELDPPRAGEVLVRLAASGVCRSDLHTSKGIHPTPLPAVLGHEGSGVVEEVGEGVRNVEPGDHVVLSWMPYCGRCRRCVAGRPNVCEAVPWSDEGLMADGTTRLHRHGLRIRHYLPSSFAERAVVPAETAIPVDQSLPLAEVALLGCAVMTGVGAVFNTARVQAGRSVAVIGCGGVGLSAVQGAAIAGASPIVAVDLVPEKLDLARELGATDTVEASGDVEAAFRKVLPDGADYVFEALGNPATIELAVGLAGLGGTTVLIGLPPPDARIPLDALTVVFQERAVVGSNYGSCVPPRDFPMLLELYRSGRLRLDPMIGSTIRLDEVNDAFERMQRGEGARTVIVFD